MWLGLYFTWILHVSSNINFRIASNCCWKQLCFHYHTPINTSRLRTIFLIGPVDNPYLFMVHIFIVCISAPYKRTDYKYAFAKGYVNFKYKVAFSNNGAREALLASFTGFSEMSKRKERCLCLFHRLWESFRKMQRTNISDQKTESNRLQWETQYKAKSASQYEQPHKGM